MEKDIQFRQSKQSLKEVMAQQKVAQQAQGMVSTSAEGKEPSDENAPNVHGVGECKNASELKVPTLDAQGSEELTTETVAETPALIQEDAKSNSAPAAVRFSQSGATTDEDVIKLRPQERKKV